MNLCDLGGYVVDASVALPTDSIDHDAGSLPVMGCTRIQCSQCGAAVRSVAGQNLRSEGTELRQLYALEDLTASPAVYAVATTRLYLCKCRSWFEVEGSHALDDPGLEPAYATNLPWRCGGHPIAALPHELDGVTVTIENLGELITRALHGWTPPAARAEDQSRSWWVARMYMRLAKTPWQTVVPAAAAACLDDADPQTRARALQFFATTPVPAGSARVLELLDTDRALFAGVPDPITTVKGDATLDDTVWRVLAPLAATPGRARELARAEAIAPGKGRLALYAALASGDAEWVAEHAEEIARATPTRVDDLIAMCRYRFPRNVPFKPVCDRLAASK